MNEAVDELKILKNVSDILDPICNQYEECYDCCLWMEKHDDCILAIIKKKFKKNQQSTNLYTYGVYRKIIKIIKERK